MLTIAMHHATDALRLACLPRSGMLIHLSQLDDPFDRQFVLLHPREATESEPSMAFDIAKKEHGIYIYMGIRIGGMHQLPPSSAGAMCSSPQHCISQHHCRPAPLLTNKWQAMPNLA